ncbi:MAG TPA: hypothetical protein VMT28_00525 [Terriglobales bacterium]|jgi:hypothetical protein|nr:hypothetical protein [Terriglobales bacterium]
MLLVISLVLALIPLLGVVWIVVSGSPATVDGLFMSLILLAMSGIFALNALLELRKGRTSLSARPATVSSAAGLVQRGTVLSVQFFESHVGQPNKSIVTLSNGRDSTHMLALEGDTRNALPVGRRVEITFRKNNGQNVLVDVTYA